MYGNYWAKYIFGDIGLWISEKCDLKKYTVVGPGAFDGLKKLGYKVKGQRAGLAAIREIQRAVNDVIREGHHPGIRAASAQGLEELTAYDVQVQLCEYKRAKRPAGLHGRLTSTRKRLRTE